MANRLKIILIIIAQLLLSYSTIAQSSILENYIQQALKNNLAIESELLLKEKQYSRIEQAKKLKGFQIDLSASYLFSEGGRELDFPIGDLFNPVNTTLNQLTGTNEYPTDLENQSFQLTPNNFLDLKLGFSKSLINSSIKYNQLIQTELLQMNDLEMELTKKELTFQVKTAYYNFLKTFEALRILDQTNQLLNDVLAFNKKLIKYDKATPDILSDVEYQIATLKSQRASVEEQQALAKASFNLLLNQSMDTDVVIDENILERNNLISENLNNLIAEAGQSRLEFKKLDVATSVNELNKKRIDKEKQPTLGMQGGVGLQTEYFNFDNGGPLYTLGFGMNWNLFDNGIRKKKKEELQIDQKYLDNWRKQLQQQVDIQVTQVYLRLQALQERIQSEEVAVKSANKSYTAVKKRYENDKAILIELTQAQNSLTRSELSKALTKYDYLIQIAALEKMIGR